MKPERLKQLFEKTGWTRKDFQDRLKEETGLRIHVRTISRWLKGKPIQKTYRDTVVDFIARAEDELS